MFSLPTKPIILLTVRLPITLDNLSRSMLEVIIKPFIILDQRLSIISKKIFCKNSVIFSEPKSSISNGVVEYLFIICSSRSAVISCLISREISLTLIKKAFLIFRITATAKCVLPTPAEPHIK